jgi:hypothetical protein
MDERTPSLQQQLADALEREVRIFEQLADRSSVEERRRALGNPFFYSGGRYDLPENEPKSAGHYTGYASHEPGLTLLQEYRAVRKQIESLQEQIRREKGP